MVNLIECNSLVPEFVKIEGGLFYQGSSMDEIERYINKYQYAFLNFNKLEVIKWFKKQHPKHEVFVNDFFMSKYLISNYQFSIFEKEFYGKSIISDEYNPNKPVMNPSKASAQAYCDWLSDKINHNVRLPTESEWEFAASSRGKFVFPWGNQFHKKLANTKELGANHLFDINYFIDGQSEQGIFDLSGSLEEWTSSYYTPYKGSDFIFDDIANRNQGTYPILRGGSFRLNADLCLASRRHGYRDDYPDLVTGLRCVY